METSKYSLYESSNGVLRPPAYRLLLNLYVPRGKKETTSLPGRRGRGGITKKAESDQDKRASTAVFCIKPIKIKLSTARFCNLVPLGAMRWETLGTRLLKLSSSPQPSLGHFISTSSFSDFLAADKARNERIRYPCVFFPLHPPTDECHLVRRG